MPETKHTPGSWTLRRIKHPEGPDNCGDPCAGERYRLEAESTLCVNIEPYQDGYVPGQTRANAYLLWAAPALYAASVKAHTFIKDLMEFYGQGLDVLNWHQNGDAEPLDSFIDGTGDGTELESLSAAIAKATTFDDSTFPAPRNDVVNLQVRLAHKAVAEWDGVDDAELIELLSKHFGRDLMADLCQHDDGKQVISGEGEPY